MKKVHIVIPDLFLPQQLAAYASTDLPLPALERLLARARAARLAPDSLESWLCGNFGVEETAIAPITLQADGMQPGAAYWLRADPVGIVMQQKQMILHGDVALTMAEATQLCTSLNMHFAVDGLHFVAPHPQRWYLKLEQMPAMNTYPLPQVVGGNMNAYLPNGADALRWHSVFNEIQMLFHEHAVNRAREQRGEAPVTAVWLWGGGRLATDMLKPFARVAGDSELASAFAQAAGLPASTRSDPLPEGWTQGNGDLLLVWEGLRNALQGAEIGKWRASVQLVEKNYIEPLMKALAAGMIEQITLDVLGEGASRRYVLTRPALWKLWCFPKPLLAYALMHPAT